MSDYISRESVLALEDDFELTLPDDEIFFSYIPVAAVEKLPAADVRPVVRGKWISEYPLSTCSVCMQSMILCDFANFCPNCGARMEES